MWTGHDALLTIISGFWGHRMTPLCVIQIEKEYYLGWFIPECR